MIKLFSRIRQQNLSEKKFSGYLLYASGEIVLVVIGILIALSINNWNESRKRNNEFKKIQQRLILDIDNDIRELNSALIFWKAKEPVFKKVMNDSMSADLFDVGLSRLLTTIPLTNLNKTGVQQLKNLNVTDELSLRIVNMYDNMENNYILRQEKEMDEQSKQLMSIFQDKYTWFPEWISKTIMKDNSSKELQAYFLTSMEYRNRVVSGYNRVYNNYVPRLEFSVTKLERIRTDLKIIEDPNFREVSKKELEQYEGSFKVTKIEGEALGIEVDELLSVTAHDSFLRISPTKNPQNFVDFFHEENRSFYSEYDGIKVSVEFDVNNSQIITGYKFEVNQLDQIIYTKKEAD